MELLCGPASYNSWVELEFRNHKIKKLLRILIKVGEYTKGDHEYES